MKAWKLRWLMNFWPPYLAAGIRVRKVSADYRYVRVEMVNWGLNRNYVNAHFGGSLFAMVDPFYMLMYINLLGSEYIVWDYAASIRYVKPGKGRVHAEFELGDEDLERVREHTRDGERFLFDHVINVIDRDGDVVAKIDRTLYFRRKDPNRRSAED